MRKVWSYPLLLVVALASLGGCSRPRRAEPANAPFGPSVRARRLLCPDVGDQVCLAACPATLPDADHIECLLQLRFGSEPETLALARALYFDKKTPIGVEMHTSVDGYRGERVALFPALPVGEHRHHLEWLNAGLERFDAFFERLNERASRPIAFEPRPQGFVFFTTDGPSYPSAYCSDGLIAYNLLGPLHAERDEMHDTLFHELFHINDARHGQPSYWSVQKLDGLYQRILTRCADDHECLERYSPHPTIVPQGTFYAFDHRTGDVREYAAELALRYFREHEAVLAGTPLAQEPFKCQSEENALSWREVVDEFFGGVDLIPECPNL